jgi:hypothetical protein
MTSTKGRPPTPKELYTAASNPQPLVVAGRSLSYAALHALKSMDLISIERSISILIAAISR